MERSMCLQPAAKAATGSTMAAAARDAPTSRPWPEDPPPPAAGVAARRSLLPAAYDRWTYRYMNPLLAKGAAQKHSEGSVAGRLTQQDLFLSPRDDEASRLNAHFWRAYARTRGDFPRTLWRLVRPTFVPAGFCQLVALCAQLGIPLCVRELLEAVEGSQGGNLLGDTVGYILGVFALSLVNALCTHRHQLLAYRSGIVVRTAVTCALYEQSLRLSPRGRAGLTAGTATNLVATDTQKLFEVMQEAHMIWSAPLAILVVVVLLLLIVGPACLVGACILAALVPLSKQVAHVIVRIRRRRVAVADERVHIVTAMLRDIKSTKLNNYEARFAARTGDARARELALVRREQCVWGFTLVVRVFTPVVASFATFATYVLVSGDHVMTAPVVFTLAMLFNMLKFPINQAGQLLSKAALGLQAMHRISHFMERETREQRGVARGVLEDKTAVLKVKKGTFFVDGSSGSGSGSSLNESAADTDGGAAFTLSGIDFKVNRGEVLAVVGAVASGKSVLLQGLLGDVRASDDTEIATAADSRVAYAAQVPFILSSTVRDNILFGAPLDRDRYERVLDACCLRPDLRRWPAGDLTEIGERGVTMSGGQRARVGVARAAYARPDLGLFDDVLGALDAGTARRLCDRLFGSVHEDGGLLRECGVVLVTHAVHVLKRVDKILVLDRGRSIFCGSWTELQSFEAENAQHRAALRSMRSSLQFSSDDNTHTTMQQNQAETNNYAGQSLIAKDTDAYKGEVISAEQREHGVSSFATWLLWFRYAGGIPFIVIQLLLMIGDRGAYVAIDWWLATWTSSAGQPITVFGRQFPDQYDGTFAQLPYVCVYAVLLLIMFVFLVARSQWAVFAGLRACRKVFGSMTHRVLHAPMSYFDVTPLGRVLNRFTYDVEQVDITLSQFMSILIIASSWLVAGQVVMISIVPYMAIVNAVVLFCYLLVIRHYRWTAADLQRLDAVSRSPIQASLAEGIDGSSTIRAYGKNDHFASEFQEYINNNSAAMLNFVASRRWLSVRLETLGAFVTLSASFFISMFNEQLGLTPGLSGLLLVWAGMLTTTLGFLMNAFSEAEAAITSIERMHSMETLPQEGSMITRDEHKPDELWPRKGMLVFDNVSLRYRPGLPLSLDGLSFTLQHGKRVAVVGRTGAGKSTLASALFRLVEIEGGTITLDGVDLSKIGLSDVRGRKNGMFILPQDPSVFAGTIQTNLDPFALHDEKDVIKALELVKFPGVHAETTLLRQNVEEGGSNFSAGEKQLLCLARAMLAKPRLLVLDEATSAVDGPTDEFVQRMLRSQFSDTTLLTIAHRLNTIIDYDAVIVMDKGKVAELGSPKELLSKADGLFTAMVHATGPGSSAQLKLMAK